MPEKPAPAKPAAPAEKPAPAKPAPAKAEAPAKPADEPAPSKAEAPPKPADEPTPAEPKKAEPKDDPFAPPPVDPFSQNDSRMRTWTDASGQHHVVARLVAVLDGGQVRLQKADGVYVRIAFDRLCTLDQQIVRDRNQAVAMVW